MDDLDFDLEKLLAETREENTASFADDTDQFGEEANPHAAEIEVSVDDLVFTLRQIATGVIDLKDKADDHEEMMVNLHTSLSEMLEEQGAVIMQLSASLDSKVRTAQASLVEKVENLEGTIQAQQEMIEQLSDYIRTQPQAPQSSAAISTKPKAKLDVPAKEDKPIPAPVPKAPALKTPTVAPPEDEPELAEEPVPNSADEELAEAEATPEEDAQENSPIVPGKSQTIRRRTITDTAKQSSRADKRKVTFTARLKRKDVEADDEATDSADTGAPADDTTEEVVAKPAKAPAIRRPERKSAQTTPIPEEAPTQHEDLPVKDKLDPSVELNTGDVPAPPIVKQTQKYVFNFKLKVSEIVRSGKVPRAGALNSSVAKFLTERSNVMMKKSLDLNARCQGKAQERYESMPVSAGGDPILFWDEDLIAEYTNFRTNWFVNDVLDKLESLLTKAQIEGHVRLIEELAMDMDMGRVDVRKGKTEYDPKRHRVKDGTQQPQGGGDIYRAIVDGVYRSGYIDLSTGQPIRKATVRVKMVQK